MSFIGPASLSPFKPSFWAGFRAHARVVFDPISCLPSPLLKRAWARAELFLGSGAISMWLAGDGLIRALSPSDVL